MKLLILLLLPAFAAAQPRLALYKESKAPIINQQTTFGEGEMVIGKAEFSPSKVILKHNCFDVDSSMYVEREISGLLSRFWLFYLANGDEICVVRNLTWQVWYTSKSYSIRYYAEEY